jgi:membrane associated rhomboid family serine protease
LIPFRDENPTRTFPYVVIALVVANAAVYLYQVLLPEPEQTVFTFTHAAIPGVLSGKYTLLGAMYAVDPRLYRAVVQYHVPVHPLQPVWLTIFTSMFLHGGFWHIAGNMLYLWIFGNNIEDTLGHFRFLVFYLVCGVVAAGAQIIPSLPKPVPMLGASGAIAGVLGAYFVLFPQARVRTLVFIFFFVTVVALPASVLLLIWFLLQLLGSLQGSLGAQGGVAFFAHIGGFITGLVLIRPFRPRRRRLRWERWE